MITEEKWEEQTRCDAELEMSRRKATHDADARKAADPRVKIKLFNHVEIGLAVATQKPREDSY